MIRFLFKAARVIYRVIIFGCVARIYNQILFTANDLVLGTSCRISGFIDVQIEKGSKIIIGDRVAINSGQFFNPMGRNQRTGFFCRENGLLQIGDNVGMSSTVIVCHEQVKIGNNVRIGNNVIIYDTDFHSIDVAERTVIPEMKQNIKKRSVLVEEGVFIGAHSIVLKGSTIGKNSIVGAGSVVAGKIPSGEIWAGNPAQFIKKIK